MLRVRLTVSGDNNTYIQVHNNEGKRTSSGILFACQITPNTNEPTHVSVSYTVMDVFLSWKEEISDNLNHFQSVSGLGNINAKVGNRVTNF
jgi:hypothetical protein